jgi:hypothetical protein
VGTAEVIHYLVNLGVDGRILLKFFFNDVKKDVN